VKKLVLFHHDPERNDEDIQKIAEEAVAYAKRKKGDSALEIVPAYCGLKIETSNTKPSVKRKT